MTQPPLVPTAMTPLTASTVGNPKDSGGVGILMVFGGYIRCDIRRRGDHLKVSDGTLLPAAEPAAEELGSGVSSESRARSFKFEMEEARDKRSNPELAVESTGLRAWSKSVELEDAEGNLGA